MNIIGKFLLWAKSFFVRSKAIPKIEVERRWLVEWSGEPLPYDVSTAIVSQIYLNSVAPEVRRIRAVGKLLRSRVEYSYYLTVKGAPVAINAQPENERKITMEEYKAYFKEIDPTRNSVSKIRTSFKHQGYIYEVDDFTYGKLLPILEGKMILEIEDCEMDDIIDFHPCIKVIREITGEKEFSNYSLSAALKKALVGYGK